MEVTSGVISPLIWVITMVTLLATPLITPHEPPSKRRIPTNCGPLAVQQSFFLFGIEGSSTGLGKELAVA